MPHVLLSVFCPDRTGLVAAIAGRLFELGVNLGDTSFAVLGTAAEFTAICRIPVHLAAEQLHDDLCALPELAGATVGVSPFGFEAEHGPSAHLGVYRVVWLRNGITGDDTHGHVDDLARFTSAYQAVIVSEDNPSDANYEPLRENAELLKRTGALVRTLPMPRAIVVRGRTPSRQLCEFLYCERDRACAGF